MGRTRTPAPAPQAPAAADLLPFVLNPHAIFSSAQLRAALNLTKETIRREVRLRRLRVARRAGKYLIPAAWVREWIESGEVRPQQPTDQAGALTPEGGGR